jgi:hypothetical protein
MKTMTVGSIIREARINAKRLQKCDAPHDFKPIPKRRDQVFQHYRCSRCGGEIDRIALGYYNMGLRHGAGGSAEKILEASRRVSEHLNRSSSKRH